MVPRRPAESVLDVASLRAWELHYQVPTPGEEVEREPQGEVAVEEAALREAVGE